MNTEAELISAVCKNKDISTLLADNVDDLFTSAIKIAMVAA